MTAGAAVADVDDDGDVDLYLTRVGRRTDCCSTTGRAASTT